MTRGSVDTAMRWSGVLHLRRDELESETPALRARGHREFASGGSHETLRQRQWQIAHMSIVGFVRRVRERVKAIVYFSPTRTAGVANDEQLTSTRDRDPAFRRCDLHAILDDAPQPLP